MEQETKKWQNFHARRKMVIKCSKETNSQFDSLNENAISTSNNSNNIIDEFTIKLSKLPFFMKCFFFVFESKNPEKLNTQNINI